MIECYNKSDVAEDELFRRRDGAVAISAKTGEGIDELLRLIEQTLSRGKHHVRLLLPYSAAGLVDTLHAQARVLACEYTPEGVAVEAVMDSVLYGRLRQYERN